MSKEYIKIMDPQPSKTGLTQIWDVVNTRTNECVGTIRYYGGWRRYAFALETAGTDWIVIDEETLGKVLAKLEAVNANRPGARRITKSHDSAGT